MRESSHKENKSKKNIITITEDCVFLFKYSKFV